MVVNLLLWLAVAVGIALILTAISVSGDDK
jgi:hypothetical protein